MAFIIKSGTIQPHVPAARQAEFNFEDMSQQASAYVDQVREQAVRILEQARQQATTMRARAQQEGAQAAVESARAAAVQTADQQWQRLQPALQQLAESVRQLQDTWLQQWETGTIRLATAIAERIIRNELRARPDISRKWVREALELAVGSNRLTVRLHPQDHETLGPHRAALRDLLDQFAEVELVADPSLAAGDCLVTTEHGEIDARLETQLARITEELSS